MWGSRDVSGPLRGSGVNPRGPGDPSLPSGEPAGARTPAPGVIIPMEGEGRGSAPVPGVLCQGAPSQGRSAQADSPVLT